MTSHFNLSSCITTLFLKVTGVFVDKRTGWPLIKSNKNYFNLEGPGIENFQIIGDAIPGGRLLGCGYPVRGTSLCIFQVKFLKNHFHHKFYILFSFHILRVIYMSTIIIIIIFSNQWVRHLQDGTRQYIEGKHWNEPWLFE